MATTTASTDTEMNTYQWVIGGLIMIALLVFMSKTDAGYRIIYYSLVLMIVFLLITQYQFIAQALQYVGTQAPDSGKS